MKLNVVRYLCILATASLSAFEPSILNPETETTLEEISRSNTLVAITFHYDEKRFCYLEKVLTSLATFPKADVVIITNTNTKEKIEHIQRSFNNAIPEGIGKGKRTISVFSSLAHPHDLTWCHKELIRETFLATVNGYTHFIYLEDDIELSFNHFCYFVHFRKALKPKGVLPSFIRFEVNKNSEFVSTDYSSRVNLDHRMQISIKNLVFVEPKNPYTACFILDQELAKEYVSSPSFEQKSSSFLCNWGIRERAAMGLCFVNIPKQFKSRYVVPVDFKTLKAPKYAWIHHLPNNYANDPKSEYGKIKMDKLFFSRAKNRKNFS